MTKVVLPKLHHEVWADPGQFGIEQGITTDEALSVLSEATWLLKELTDQTVHGGGYWEDRIRIYPGTCDVWLSHGPVVSIVSCYRTHNCGVDQERMDDVCIIDDRALRVCCSTPCAGLYSCGCDDWNIVVQYEQAPCLPPGSDRVVKELASEYVKARSGQPCKLPERINNVTRQGVSWTIMDPQTFLKEGLTGMGTIDHWLSVAKTYCGPDIRIVDPFKGIVVRSRPLENFAAGGPFLGSAFSKAFDVPDAPEDELEIEEP